MHIELNKEMIKRAAASKADNEAGSSGIKDEKGEKGEGATSTSPSPFKEKIAKVADRIRTHKREALAAGAALLLVLGISSCSISGNVASNDAPSNVNTSITTNTHSNSAANTSSSKNENSNDNLVDSGQNQSDSQQPDNQQPDIQGSSNKATAPTQEATKVSVSSIPAYSGSPYIEINGNVPEFSDYEKGAPYGREYYGELDHLGRCTSTFAVVGRDTMPTEERGSIGMIKPTGWHTIKYNNVEGKYLYNRCYLIGYQLTAENANTSNLITGTRYLNTKGMLPFEDRVADYVKSTGNHVWFKAVPIFDGNNLLASGVHMMAESIEDWGRGVSYNVYCYNAQPGIIIDYATGESWAQDPANNFDDSSTSNSGQSNNGGASAGSNAAPVQTQPAPSAPSTPSENASHYVLNTSTKKIHIAGCSAEKQIKPENRSEVDSTILSLEAQGYSCCKKCM